MKNKFDKQCEKEGKIPTYTDGFHESNDRISKKQKSFSYVLFTGTVIVAVIVILAFIKHLLSDENKNNANNKISRSAVGAGILFIVGAIMMVVGGIGYTAEDLSKPTDKDFVQCE